MASPKTLLHTIVLILVSSEATKHHNQTDITLIRRQIKDFICIREIYVRSEHHRVTECGDKDLNTMILIRKSRIKGLLFFRLGVEGVG